MLIVDDDPITHRVLRHYLEDVGYKLITAKSGGEALAVATRELPQLIIMDVLMPEMNGLEALRKLKHLDATKDIPVIVLTSSRLRLTQLESTASGAAVFLTKPFKKSSLLAAVQSVVKPSAPRVASQKDEK